MCVAAMILIAVSEWFISCENSIRLKKSWWEPYVGFFAAGWADLGGRPLLFCGVDSADSGLLENNIFSQRNKVKSSQHWMVKIN